MPRRRYTLALACYLTIPAVLIAGGSLFSLIDPEMARNHADYVRDYRLLNLVRMVVLMLTAGLAVILWLSCCYLVIQSRQDASGGMWAFSEGLEVIYLVVLIYLLWPILFNFAGNLLEQRTTHQDPESSGG
jgi:hypothetical protein